MIGSADATADSEEAKRQQAKMQGELDKEECKKENAYKVSMGRLWALDNSNKGLYALGAVMALCQVRLILDCIRACP